MTEASAQSAATQSAVGNKGVKRGLPLDGLRGAARSATVLWEVARLGLAPNMAFAEKLGRKSASGGGWDRLVAVLRGFGLVRLESEQIGLSPLGQELVNGSNPAQQMAARRTALLHLKAYRELVDSFDGTKVPDDATLASRLKFEYGKADDFAAKAAQAFLDSLSFAEMVDNQGCVRRNGADAAVDPKPNVEDEDEQADLIDGAFEDASDVGEESATAVARAEESAATLTPGSSNRGARFEGLQIPASVNVTVTLDLSTYRADEVVQILKALKG